jgi:MFS family permease
VSSPPESSRTTREDGGAGRSQLRQWAALDARVWRVAFARAVNTMGLSLVMAFLGIYVVETRGYPAWLYGVIALVANLGQSLSSAWAGNLSDRIGRRPLITTSLFIRAAVIAALGTQVLLDAPLWSLALNMVASSALRGGFEPVAYALVADVVKPEDRIAAFGLQRMSTNLGWAIGPALGGVLSVVLPYGVVFYFAAAGVAIAGIVTLGVIDPVVRTPATTERPTELGRALREAWRDPLLRTLLVGTFLAAVVHTQMFATLGIYLTDELGRSKADVGWLYALNGAGVLLLQIPALGVIRRLGFTRALPWAALGSAMGFALIGLATGLGGAALAIVVITCAEVVFAPAHQAAIAEAADPARRGAAFGVAAFSQMIGIALAPLYGGVLLDTVGHHHAVMWLAIAAIGVAQAACFVAFARKRESRSPAAPWR